MARIDEEDFIFFLLIFIKKPQSTGQGDGVEEVTGDGDHHIDGTALNNLFADFHFTAAGVAGGVGHDKTGAAFVVECRVEQLYPDVVAVVGARHAEGETGFIIFQAVFLDGIYIEGWIGHDKIELAGAVVDVLVVGVAFADVALQAMHGEVHFGEAHGVAGFFLAIYRQFIAGGAL